MKVCGNYFCLIVHHQNNVARQRRHNVYWLLGKRDFFQDNSVTWYHRGHSSKNSHYLRLLNVACKFPPTPKSLSCCMCRTRPYFLAYWVQILAVVSVELLSDMIMSKSRYVCWRRASMEAPRVVSPLRTGTPMVIRGNVEIPSLKRATRLGAVDFDGVISLIYRLVTQDVVIVGQNES